MQIRKWLQTLYVQVLIAIIIGVLLGHYYPKLGVDVKPLGDMFIKLIKMIITPIVFTTVVLGICGVGSIKKIGTLGLKTISYFYFASTLAMIIGLVVVNFVQPGVGINADPAALAKEAAKSGIVTSGNKSVVSGGFMGFLMDLIPGNIVDSFAKGNILQVLVFSIMFGFALASAGDHGKKVQGVIQELFHILFRIIGYVMKVAPIGAFGAMGFTVGKFGIASLWSLGKLMGTFYLTCFMFVILVLGTVTWWCRVSLWNVIKYFKDEIFITLGTASTEAVMPRLLTKLEHLGCSKSVTGLVIPTGYSFNLDGAAIYFTMASIFLAQATNIHLDLGQQLTLLAVLMVTSKGGAGVVGSAFVVLTATLESTRMIPVEAMALILGIDRFMNEARAVTNLIGNTIATLAVARWQGELDMNKYHSAMADMDKGIEVELEKNLTA